MKYALIVFCVCTAVRVPMYAQSQSGSLQDYLNEWLDDIPGSTGNDYVTPSEVQLQDWNQVVNLILNGNLNNARNTASNFNYEVVEYTDQVDIPGQDYYVLRESEPRMYHWGIFVFNTASCRSILNLQAPHPKKDHNTGKQAIYCFSKLNANSLIISGTNRCNHDQASSCDGTTSVCLETSSPFQISDMAHNVNTPFQQTTEVVNTHDANSVFLQFHGFGQQSTDPDLIISNGSRTIPSNDYINLFKNELLAIDGGITFKIGHLDTDWDRLLGFTNTQGRYINGSTDPCDDAAEDGSGRFIHLEQERDQFRADETGWELINTALSNTFECAVVNSFQNRNVTSDQVRIFPMPVNNESLTIVSNEGPISSVSLYDLSGREIINARSLGSSEIELNLPWLKSGIYYLNIIVGDQKFRRKFILD